MKPDIHPHYRTVVFHDTSAARFRQRFGGFINAKRG